MSEVRRGRDATRRPTVQQAKEGMPVKLRTYQAYTMAEALAAVKRDLGADAVIVQTRSFRRGGFLGIGRRAVVEVTAAVAPQDESDPIATAGAGATRARTSRAASAYRATSSVGATAAPSLNGRSHTNGSVGEHAGEPAPVTEIDRERTRRLAMALVERHEREAAARHEEATATAVRQAPAPSPSDAPSGSAADVSNGGPESRTDALLPTGDGRTASSVATPVVAPVAQRFTLVTEGDGDTPDAPHGAPETVVRATNHDLPVAPPRAGGRAGGVDERADAAPAEDGAAGLGEELAAIRDLVGRVLERQVAGEVAPGADAMPRPLLDAYLHLIGQDVSRDLASEVVADVRRAVGDDRARDEATVRTEVLRALERLVPVAETPVSISTDDRRPVTVALIGPTGVGKTTTLAKLAASFKLRHGRRVAMITCDTYRIAAVEQLRTYASIIGVPLEVVMNPSEMEAACARLSDRDVVLIDTAGRSQRDSERLEELRGFVDAADPHEVHLVLSSTASEKVLLREVEAFSAIRTDKIVLTKLDEAVSFGMLLNVVRRVGKSISFLTTGQEVPDQIEVGRSSRLAELVMDGAEGS